MSANPQSLDSPLATALAHHQAGRLDAAEILYRAALKRDPKLADALHLLGLIALARAQYDAARELIEQAIAARQNVAGYHNSLGAVFQKLNQSNQAEQAFVQATILDPKSVQAWKNLAKIRTTQGNRKGISEALQGRAKAAPNDADAHQDLAIHHYDMGRSLDAMACFADACDQNPDRADIWLRYGLVALEIGDEQRALTAFTRARNRHFAQPDLGKTTVRTKLQHDAEQVDWLIENGRLHAKAHEISEAYKTVCTKLFPDASASPVGRTIPPRLQNQIAKWYNRPLYIEPCPAMPQGALSPDIDVQGVCERYSAQQPGITWVDDFLRPEALEALRHFCMASTIWTDFRYSGGYVGTTLSNGFANGLLLQIAQQLRTTLPDLFSQHPLRQMWAFKYDSQLHGITPHADSAAINVNFWITPDAANLDPNGGGLVVYRKEAPAQWDFEDFNRQPKKLMGWLKQTDAERIVIAHRQNRAAIFNSNLVHETDTLSFGSDYADRRINITMLFGKRGG